MKIKYSVGKFTFDLTGAEIYSLNLADRDKLGRIKNNWGQIKIKYYIW